MTILTLTFRLHVFSHHMGQWLLNTWTKRVMFCFLFWSASEKVFNKTDWGRDWEKGWEREREREVERCDGAFKFPVSFWCSLRIWKATADQTGQAGWNSFSCKGKRSSNTAQMWQVTARRRWQPLLHAAWLQTSLPKFKTGLVRSSVTVVSITVPCFQVRLTECGWRSYFLP